MSARARAGSGGTSWTVVLMDVVRRLIRVDLRVGGCDGMDGDAFGGDDSSCFNLRFCEGSMKVVENLFRSLVKIVTPLEALLMMYYYYSRFSMVFW